MVPALCLLALALTGCTTSNPIGTSLLDITGESRVTKVEPGLFGLFPLFEQHEAFSVNGLLPMPDVGLQFHFTGEGDPTSAIGIAVAQSYKIIGESEGASRSDVTAIRTNLDRVQLLTLRLATEDQRINSLRTELRNLSTNDQRNVSISNLVNSINRELHHLTLQQTTNRSQLRAAQEQLSESANKPGITIARWRARDSIHGLSRSLPTWRAAWAIC
jgi:hypothetical protein